MKASQAVRAISSATSNQCSKGRMSIGRQSIGGRRRPGLHRTKARQSRAQVQNPRPTLCEAQTKANSATRPPLWPEERSSLWHGQGGLDAYQEAEDPRQVLEQMRSQARFPWKVLAFDQQIRPPYSGKTICRGMGKSAHIRRNVHQEVGRRRGSDSVQAGPSARLLVRFRRRLGRGG